MLCYRLGFFISLSSWDEAEGDQVLLPAPAYLHKSYGLDLWGTEVPGVSEAIVVARAVAVDCRLLSFLSF